MRTLCLYDVTGIVSILEIPSHATRDAALTIARAALSLANERGWGVEYTSDEPLHVARDFVLDMRDPPTAYLDADALADLESTFTAHA